MNRIKNINYNVLVAGRAARTPSAHPQGSLEQFTKPPNTEGLAMRCQPSRFLPSRHPYVAGLGSRLGCDPERDREFKKIVGIKKKKIKQTKNLMPSFIPDL